ncbi:MAG: FkbM family methyltransferase [Bryobacterales bacterium]|nr:FkbM family methyltransferase [Bryobacterales bacterium]
MLGLLRKSLLRKPLVRRLAGAAVCKFIPEYLRVDGVRIAMNQRDPVVCGALTFRQYERDELRFVRAAVRPGMRVVDVGANVGLYTALFASQAGEDGLVVALEPDPVSFHFLKKTVEANGFRNCHLLNTGASSSKGTMTLYTSSENRGDNRLYRNGSADGSAAVEVLALDDVLPTMGLSSIDFLKMDIQGFEGHAAMGLRETLRRSPGLMAMIEFWPDGLSQAGSDALELLRLFRGLGFTIYRLQGNKGLVRVNDDHALIREHPGWSYANLVLLGPDAPAYPSTGAASRGRR